MVGGGGAMGALGAVGGGVVYLGLLGAAAAVVRAQTGVVIDVWAWDAVLWVAPAGLVGLAVLGGVVPAVAAYRTPVAPNLAPVS